MKLKLLFIYIFVLMNFGLAQVNQAEKNIEKANTFYQNSDFENAIEEYKKVILQGYESAPLYYNLANSYFKIDRLGYSIYYFEKATKLNPSDEDIKFNLEIAKSRTLDKIDELPKFFLVSWWESFSNMFSLTVWTVIILLSLILCMFFILYYLYGNSYKLKQYSFYLFSLFLVFTLLTGAITYSKIYTESSTTYAILLTENIVTKNSPDNNSNDAFVIHEGIKFTIEDELKDWVKIRLLDGKVAWLQKNHIGIL